MCCLRVYLCRKKSRLTIVVVVHNDIKTGLFLLQMEKMRKKVVTMSIANTTWEDVCFRIPAVKPGLLGFTDIFGRRRKRSFFFLPPSDDSDSVGGLQFDPSLLIGYSRYCSIVNNLPKLCLEVNLGQLWNNNEREISSLDLEDVVEALHDTKVSPVYGHPTDFKSLLGDVVKDKRGRIISAGSLLSVWLTHVNYSQVNMDETGNSAGTSDMVSGPSSEWEGGYLNLLANESEAYKGTNLTVYYEAGRSYGDISSESMFQDVGKLFIGSLLMFSFVQFVLPTRLNWVEFRFGLGCIGLACIGLSFVLAISLCSLLGIFYGPVHTSLPFLLLGIGVDDMFVIISCWKHLTGEERKLRHEEKIAVALKHAGVSITVTSITDLMAFLIGSFTILPSLHSFCLYTAAGVLFMFIFQATMFVAFLSIDEKRIEKGRNSILWCIEHKNFRPQESASESLQMKVFDFIYSKLIFKLPFKIFVILVTIILAGVAVKGNLELKQKFDPKWFLPNNSYLLQFYSQRNHFYPDVGKSGAIYVGNVNYTEDIGKIHQLSLIMQNQTAIVKNIDTWTSAFLKYTRKAFRVDLLKETVPESTFKEYLSKFLWSPNGARFQKNFRFDGDLICGQPTPDVAMSLINFVFKRFDGPEEYIPAMNKLKGIVKDANVTSGDGFATVWSKIFANWVTDEIIDRELYRNLGMALCCIMFCTGILIVDIQICFWIFTCVLLTLVDVAGFIYFWGLYIDVASCIALVLAVGLCVDYAAHVGHVFLTFKGTRDERALKTVKYIGTATVNGAFSTLLAVSLLGNSDAYIFQTFFKIFFLVTLFGLFHGVVFLPVVLSLVGPEPYNHGDEVSRTPKSVIANEIGNGSEDVKTLKNLLSAEDCINR
ncbi:hypothetical protein RUM44_013465 [Polyplax serrata]|uniref:SSD domain-containing protein n=1 Tax=Polyplax serrata TaxID=468196 RepID=A0ABR1BII6_POLSC